MATYSGADVVCDLTTCVELARREGVICVRCGFVQTFMGRRPPVRHPAVVDPQDHAPKYRKVQG